MPNYSGDPFQPDHEWYSNTQYSRIEEERGKCYKCLHSKYIGIFIVFTIVALAVSSLSLAWRYGYFESSLIGALVPDAHEITAMPPITTTTTATDIVFTTKRSNRSTITETPTTRALVITEAPLDLKNKNSEDRKTARPKTAFRKKGTFQNLEVFPLTKRHEITVK